MNLHEFVAYLDDYLCVRDVPDYKDAFNGLQVEGERPVRRVAAAVDACFETIRQAAAWKADLLLVHHGLFWGAKAPLSGAYYRRVKALIESGMALYSSHLPLDVHPEVGNNHVLARKLGLSPSGSFLDFQGAKLAVTCECDLDRDMLIGRIQEAVGQALIVMAKGPERIRRAGICTGGAGGGIGEAADAGCDLFLTGEGPHHTYFDAEERGINVVYAGHYATETFGVRAIAERIGQEFRLETAFLDHPTGL